MSTFMTAFVGRPHPIRERSLAQRRAFGTVAQRLGFRTNQNTPWAKGAREWSQALSKRDVTSFQFTTLHTFFRYSGRTFLYWR